MQVRCAAVCWMRKQVVVMVDVRWRGRGRKRANLPLSAWCDHRWWDGMDDIALGWIPLHPGYVNNTAWATNRQGGQGRQGRQAGKPIKPGLSSSVENNVNCAPGSLKLLGSLQQPQAGTRSRYPPNKDEGHVTLLRISATRYLHAPISDSIQPAI